MNATTYFESQHGKETQFLSKDAVIKFAEDFAELRKQEFTKAKEAFNSERWMAQEELRRKFPKKD